MIAKIRTEECSNPHTYIYLLKQIQQMENFWLGNGKLLAAWRSPQKELHHFNYWHQNQKTFEKSIFRCKEKCLLPVY